MTCDVCGATMQSYECDHCNGSGDDPDYAVENGRYVVMPCWCCAGAGTTHHCPNEADKQHMDAYDAELQVALGTTIQGSEEGG